jgi:hypothetical protein
MSFALIISVDHVIVYSGADTNVTQEAVPYNGLLPLDDGKGRCFERGSHHVPVVRTIIKLYVGRTEVRMCWPAIV